MTPATPRGGGISVQAAINDQLDKIEMHGQYVLWRLTFVADGQVSHRYGTNACGL